ncbi:glycosyltransferase [Pseudoduganella sp. SL102]|uniref:glycosyltransferase n=1 Tax=Pseudoduganella sp. SL102 TaxID=2995154 RepID=UPI00248CD940|nr:glycosyltransferase [Pseudoduganella sp. SL102]WBS01685.1 glycosyltransferase [Pseudoduganella sp. SL102]
MKFTFLTYGTEGDTRPLLALAQALAAHGHQVHLLADRSAAASAQARGIGFTPLAGDIRQALAPHGSLGRVVRQGANLDKITRAFAAIASGHTVEWMRAAREAAEGSDALVFSGLASYAGLAVAEGLDLPCVGAGLWPMTPTGDFPSVFLRQRRWPRWANRASHRLFAGLAWTSFRDNIDHGRHAVFGQPPVTRMWSGYPVLYGCSPTLLPEPADWPGEVEVCGAWHAADRAWRPPPALAAFLEQGEPPAYIGFGSMAGFDTRTLRHAIVEAVGGRRALFYPGWSGIDAAGLPANFHVLDDTPHDWLFPRTSVIVHHGGAGTSHAAARSGVPSVVVPFAGDQFFWADRLARLGIAGVCPAPRRLDSAMLRGLMDRAGGLRDNARAVAARMSVEDGVRAARHRLLGGVAKHLAPAER